MKKKYFAILSTVAFIALSSLCSAAPAGNDTPAKVRTVNFKSCVEQSKIGKQEQAAFEALKKQMESVLLEKEKVLNDMAAKMEDADYLDSLSSEAETEMKRKFRGLSQEYAQLQNQYLQTLNQTNMKVLQKINEVVAEASKTAAKQNNIDLVFNDETCFFASPSFDISQQIIAIMDQMHEKEAVSNKGPNTTGPQPTLPNKK